VKREGGTLPSGASDRVEEEGFNNPLMGEEPERMMGQKGSALTTAGSKRQAGQKNYLRAGNLPNEERTQKKKVEV